MSYNQDVTTGDNMSDYGDEMDGRGQDHDLRTGDPSGDERERVRAIIAMARRHLHEPPPPPWLTEWAADKDNPA